MDDDVLLADRSEAVAAMSRTRSGKRHEGLEFEVGPVDGNQLIGVVNADQARLHATRVRRP